MAKQSAPVAAEPATKEPAAEPAASQPAPTPAPSVEELQKELEAKEGALASLRVELDFMQKVVESKEASLTELASKLADAREHASKAEENAQRVAELEGLVAERDKTLRDLAFKLADAHDKLEHSKPPAPELRSDRSYACVALRKMRAPDGWVAAGDEFAATPEQLEGYAHGEHFVTKD